MGLNSKQIAFISCVNDENEYAECRYYLDRLRVPEGYETDMIAVREAPSMTAGYNAGMQSSEAKYKVYLHQDVFIKNENFIFDLLKVFRCDESIGMAGMIGTVKLGKDALATGDWNAGKILHNCAPPLIEYPPEEGVFMEVQAVDGLMLATQYDIPWREDIFDGWDFYDISQCMEFQKAGYKIVIPYQTEPWCYHDNEYSKMTNYEKYRKLFIQEYAAIGDFEFRKTSEEILAYERTKESVRKKIREFMARGMIKELRDIFQNPDNRGYLYLREYEAIVQIDRMEEESGEELRFWQDNISLEQLLLKLRMLKYALKRIEYGAVGSGQDKKYILENYSPYAVRDVCSRYVVYKDRVYAEIGITNLFLSVKVKR